MISSKKLIKYKSIKHAFFNKKGGVSKGIYKSLNCGMGSKDKKINVFRNLKIVSNKIGCSYKNLIFLKQVHSDKIIKIKKNYINKFKADGLITKQKKMALSILTADCVPILIFDPNKKIIGACHAGWRGAFKKIFIKIIKKFINMGSNKNDLIVVLGPSIEKGSYEVKNNFKKKFISQNKKNMKFFSNKKGKIFFSLKDYIKVYLSNYGIKNIEVIKKDTFNKKNYFFSSRRSLKNKENDYGRNISVIMIK
tara:strand:+ start:426 stop:1178 length:753 start_codon:yes stop_codon:yes gene_type:complete